MAETSGGGRTVSSTTGTTTGTTGTTGTGAVTGTTTMTMSDDVVAVIAGIAARGVPGVFALSGQTPAPDPRHPPAPGTSNGTAPGVLAAVGEREAAVDLALVAEYGTDLVDVAERVRQEVVSSVLRMTELRVTEVNVTVVDLHLGARDAEQPGRVR